MTPYEREVLAEFVRRRSRRGPDSIVDFIPWLTRSYDPPAHLAPLFDVLERSRTEPVEIVVSVPPRHAKALAVTTPMLTARGWLRAGDVVVGDLLVGSDGEWTRVCGVHPQGTVPLFRISFSDRSTLITCAAHRWSVAQRYGGPYRVKTTGDLALDLLESDGRRKWHVPMASPCIGMASALPIPPYLFGAWLGDGHSGGAQVTTADAQIVAEFAEAGYSPTKTKCQSSGRAFNYYLYGGMCRALRLLGVIRNKHIPMAYLLAPVADRLALLQGLCDTDGTVHKNGSYQSFCTTRPALAQGFRRLIGSLGGKCTEHVYPAAKKLAHAIQFRLPVGMEGFRLRRKQNRLRSPSVRNSPRRWVAAIEAASAGEAVCFEVEAQDHLFCAGDDCILTHNTESILHWIVWTLLRDPSETFAYISYASDFADNRSRRARRLAVKAGVELGEKVTEGYWETDAGGFVKSTGILGQLTGEGFTKIVVDDPIKNREEAESQAMRQKIYDAFVSDIYTRRDPRGTSVIVVHTRWHADDLAGRLIADGWPSVNLQAIDDGTGAALWERKWPLDGLGKLRSTIGDYAFSSLYQGRPVPRGQSLFGPPTYWDIRPLTGYRAARGVDLAYSAKTHADSSVSLVLLADGYGSDAVYYVVDVLKRQVKADQFAACLKAHEESYPGSVGRWYCSTTERGLADLLGKLAIHVEGVLATADKFVRAQPVAAAWNAGRVRVPRKAPWLDDFLRIVQGFSGVGDAHDDEVDALAAAFDALDTSAGARYLKVAESWQQNRMMGAR